MPCDPDEIASEVASRRDGPGRLIDPRNGGRVTVVRERIVCASTANSKDSRESLQSDPSAGPRTGDPAVVETDIDWRERRDGSARATLAFVSLLLP
jgi:hypothetical protein